MIEYKPQVSLSNLLAVFIVYKFQFRCINAYTKSMPYLRMNFKKKLFKFGFQDVIINDRVKQIVVQVFNF